MPPVPLSPNPLSPDQPSADHPSLDQMFVTPVRGPAYRPFFRYFTFCVLLQLFAYGLYALNKAGEVATPIVGLLAMAALVVMVSGWYILTGKTTIDQQGIRQDWFSPKVYRWPEIIRARVVKLPGSVRLVLHTGNGPFKAIHSGNAELDQAFRRIADYYRQ